MNQKNMTTCESLLEKGVIVRNVDWERNKFDIGVPTSEHSVVVPTPETNKRPQQGRVPVPTPEVPKQKRAVAPTPLPAPRSHNKMPTQNALCW